MTVPTVPGPFSFLASAGEALGNVGTVLEAKRQRLDSEARQRLQDILALLQTSPESADELAPAAQSSAQRLGLLATPPKEIAPGVPNVVLPDVVGATPEGFPITQSPGQRLLAGPAERARLALATARSGASTAASEATIKGVEATNAPALGTAGVRSAEAGATAAETAAAAAKSDLPVRQRINELVTKELKDPASNFGRLAAYAAAGILPYFTAMRQIAAQSNALERERMRELFTLFYQPLHDATSVYNARIKEHQRLRGIAEITYQGDANGLKDWEAKNPEPSFLAVQEELLSAAAQQRGLSPDEYNRLLNEAVGVAAQADNQAFPPAKLEGLKALVAKVQAGAPDPMAPNGGALTPEAAEAKIQRKYAARIAAHDPTAQAEMEMDILRFRQLLQEAQGVKPPR